MSVAVNTLHRDLAFAKSQDRAGVESVVIAHQATVREVLLEIERLKDQIKSPEAYAHRRTEYR